MKSEREQLETRRGHWGEGGKGGGWRRMGVEGEAEGSLIPSSSHGMNIISPALHFLTAITHELHVPKSHKVRDLKVTTTTRKGDVWKKT